MLFINYNKLSLISKQSLEVSMKKILLTGFFDEVHEDFSLQIKAMKELKINYLEIRGVNGRNITNHTLEEAKALKKQMDLENIKVSAIGSPIGKILINEPFEKHLKLFKHTIELAKIFQTKYIRIFSFYLPNDYTNYHREVIKRLKIFTEIAGQNNIILLHENEKNIYGDIPERILDIIETIDSPHLKLTFDFANFIQCEVNPLKAYKKLKTKIEYLHIKDALIKTKEVVPAGLGDGHIEEILADLIKSNYQGFLSLEPHLGTFKGLKDLELDIEFDEVDDNGLEKFKLAHQALVKILNKIMR